jgi:hypothetical protein
MMMKGNVRAETRGLWRSMNEEGGNEDDVDDVKRWRDY